MSTGDENSVRHAIRSPSQAAVVRVRGKFGASGQVLRGQADRSASLKAKGRRFGVRPGLAVGVPDMLGPSLAVELARSWPVLCLAESRDARPDGRVPYAGPSRANRPAAHALLGQVCSPAVDDRDLWRPYPASPNEQGAAVN